MLTQQRYDAILKILDERKSVTLQELKELLDTSESTVRRDLTALDQMGRLVKVFGGAVAAEFNYQTEDDVVEERASVHTSEKQNIASYAAALIRPEDFVYIDAGTTTGGMLEFLREDVAYVTNGVVHAQKMAALGLKVTLLGGELKKKTEATVGSQTLAQLAKYNFTVGFFGVNGVSRREGFTTPDAAEAAVKEFAMSKCHKKYVLCDSSKFSQISPVTFGAFDNAVIITEHRPDGFKDCENIIECR